MDKVISYGRIENGNVTYNDISEIKQFFKENDGKGFEVTYKLSDKVKTYIHKYYRGRLLQDIASAYGEKNINKVHIRLKYDFMLKRCSSLDEIPKKYLKAVILVDRDLLDMYVNTDCCPKEADNYYRILDNCEKTNIIVTHGDQIYGYIRSMSMISNGEGKKFLGKCENRLFVDLSSRIGVSAKTNLLNYYQHEVAKYRKEIFNDRKE